jgi:hypothetical protein
MNEMQPCAKCQTLAHLSALNTCPACVNDWLKEFPSRNTRQSKGYSLNVWADGFGRWHAKATFSPALGNLGEAERVANNALANAKRQLRQAIEARQPRYNLPLPRLSYAITANEFTPGIGTLRSLTISEK